jgi:hypothetical protein
MGDKGIARETIFLIVLGFVTVFIILWVLWQVIPHTGGWTPQCSAKVYAFCAEWSVRGWDPTMTWTAYAPECPTSGPTSQLACRSYLSTAATTS